MIFEFCIFNFICNKRIIIIVIENRWVIDFDGKVERNVYIFYIIYENVKWYSFCGVEFGNV